MPPLGAAAEPALAQAPAANGRKSVSRPARAPAGDEANAKLPASMLAQAPAVGRGEVKTRLKQSVIPSLNRR